MYQQTPVHMEKYNVSGTTVTGLMMLVTVYTTVTMNSTTVAVYVHWSNYVIVQ